jgi:hypothetical protein
MPVIGTGAAARLAIKTARNTVRDQWEAKNKVLTPEERDQMLDEMETAGLNAMFAHMSSHMQVSGVAGVGLISPSGAVTGSVILPPGSIT